MNKLKAVGFIALVAVLAGWTTFLATQSIHRTPPFTASGAVYDSAAAGSPGGWVVLYNAADSLRIGEVVYVSANNTVDESATHLDYNALAGVVVGGERITNFGAGITASEVGTLAATVGQQVWVLKRGRTWVTADASDSVLFGEQIIPSNATAGAVEPRTTALDSSYRVIGRAVHSVAASAVVAVDVSIK